MDEPREVLDLRHQHRPLAGIDADLGDVCTEIDDELAKRKTLNDGVRERLEAYRATYKRLMEERRRAVAVQRVIHSQTGGGGE